VKKGITDQTPLSGCLPQGKKIMKEVAAQEGKGEKIERKWLISLLYRPINEISSLNREQLDKIIGEYPVIGQIYDAVTGFK